MFHLKKILFNSILYLLIVFTFSCSSSLNVTTDYDKSIDFANYKTFSLYNIKTVGSVSQLNADRITNSIRSEMTRKGFIESSYNPDMMVNAVTFLKNKQAVSSTTNYYGYGGLYRPYRYYGGMGMGMASTSINTYNYKEGSLTIDIVDSKTQKVIWQATGNKEIDSAPQNPDEAISKAIIKIMAGFYPNKKK